jgi:hypothetical protein
VKAKSAIELAIDEESLPTAVIAIVEERGQAFVLGGGGGLKGENRRLQGELEAGADVERLDGLGREQHFLAGRLKFSLLPPILAITLAVREMLSYPGAGDFGRAMPRFRTGDRAAAQRTTNSTAFISSESASSHAQTPPIRR